MIQTVIELGHWLNNHPEVRWTNANGYIDVKAPPHGLSVWIMDETDEWTVGFEGWHTHFNTEQEAVRCFIWILSGKCRIKISYRGKFAYRWTAEEKTDGGWKGLGTTAYLFFPCWRRKTTEYRQITPIVID